MSARDGVRSAFLAAAVLLLFATLVLLIGSLDRLSFDPGKRIARVEQTDEEAVEAQTSTVQLTKKERIYAYVLGGLTLLSIVCVFIFRKLRRQLIQYLFTLFSFVLPMLLGFLLVSRFLKNWLNRPADGAALAGRPEIPDAIVANPPTWSIALAAAGLAVLLLGMIAVLVVRSIAMQDRIRHARLEDAAMDLEAEQRAFAKQAGDTARRIRSGESLHGEVIRCYREMDRFLSKRRRLRPTYLTPREFQSALEGLGIRSAHIAQLTRLFELVRYGKRDDESLAEEALACLDQLRTTYGGEEIDEQPQAV